MYQRIPDYYNNSYEYDSNYMSQQQYYNHNVQQHPYLAHLPYPNDPTPPPTPFSQYAKPAQPQNWPPFMQQNANFYPPQQEMQQPNNSLLAYFQDQNGQMDFGKMLTTVNQVASTFQQVTPVIQQINSIIKSFR